MARQSLLWTALPNGLAADGSLRVSLVLSPRLDPEGEPPVLATFPEWLDWPATLNGAAFTIRYGAGAATVVLGADPLDDRIGVPDSAAWQALFGAALPVVAGEYVDHGAKTVVSYEAADLDALVADLYGAMAAAADGDLPTVTDVLGTAGWDGLVSDVGRIDDRRHFDPHTGLRVTQRLFDEYREHRLQRLEGRAALLARAQLFHTPPSRQDDVVARARDDDARIDATWRQHAKTELPSPDELAARLDFHRIAGAMSSYPTVLRRLGLVIDLVLPRGEFADNADAALSVEVKLADGALTVPQAPDVSPVVHAALSASAFAAVPDPAVGADDARVPDRLLELDPGRFAVLQADVDGAGIKLLNFARSLSRLATGDARVDAVTRAERRIGVPALRTAGLMLVHRRRGPALEARLGANGLKNQAAQDVIDAKPGAVAPDLYAEDTLRGYRIDVWDETTGVWRSLCRREAVYKLGGGVIVEPVSGEEEGIVRLAATGSPDPSVNQDLLWLHEAVLSWTGWSLCAPLPGRAIRPDDTVGGEQQTEAELPPGLEFSSTFRAVRGSLPRLRYGRSYWLRARAVDLAGNSLDPQDHDFGPERPDLHAQTFLRYEPVAAPIVALVRREDGTTERPFEGESMLRMAIRSRNDTPADNAEPSPETARRFAVPAQVSAREAEQHGMLDDGGRVSSATFQMLANDRDRDALDPDAALVEETIAMQGPLDAAPVDTTFAAYRDGVGLTHLPDPVARAAGARILGHPDADPEEVIPISLYADGTAWPDALPFKVQAVDKPGERPAFDAASRTLVVPLPKAERAIVRLSMLLGGRALHDVMGVWRWVSAPTNELEDLTRTGRHWMLTPWTEIEVVHAVQRPLLDPTFDKLMLDRDRGDTSVRPRFLARVSLKSTDRVDLHAEWHEPSDDTALPGGVDHARGDTAFAVKVTGPDDYATLQAGHARGGIPDHAILGEDLIDVGFEAQRNVARKVHELGDTRYRRIEYWLEGTTRFREFLPAELLADAGPDGELVPTDEHIKVVGPREVRWVPSSAPPPAPAVLSVVPTFGWVRSRGAEATAKSWRRGGGLRVYLDRSWNQTGYGEMLAVVLAPGSFAGDPETAPAGRPYKGRVTQWGTDPVWDSAPVAGLAPKRSAFPRARTSPDPAGSWLPAGAPATEADQPPGPFSVVALGDVRAPVEVAPHDVAYDAERQLWYCDIEIDHGGAYAPFVRLALARYQPVSVFGCELSDVVLADFMPLVADRWLTVSPGRAPGTRRIDVYGTAPAGSSAAQESGQFAQGAAKVSGGTVVEVTLERLDPSLGEDFGWQRVATVEPDAPGALAPPQRGGVGNRFVPAHRSTRASALRAAGRLDDLITEDLVDALEGFLRLWRGTVTVPAEPGGRLRLAIAEYEEYLVDDAAPYDDPPTAKDRRLVFLEHVELT